MKIKFNLLPKKQKDHLRRRKTFRIIIEQEIHIMIVFLFLIMGLFAMYFILKTEISVMEGVKAGVTENERYKDAVSIHDEFVNINKRVDLVDKLNKNHIKWSRIIILLSENITNGIIIDSIKTLNDSVSVKAQAETRENVLELKSSLKEVKHNEAACFTDIVVPEEQLATPVDISFTMTFKVNLDCLK